jgi:hypothetical protein
MGRRQGIIARSSKSVKIPKIRRFTYSVKKSIFTENPPAETPREINGYLQLPFSMTISGCSGSGKSHFVKMLLLNQKAITGSVWSKIFYISRFELLDLKRDLKHLPIEFLHENIPSIEYLKKKSNPHAQCLVIADDLMTQASNSLDIKSLFSEGRHIKFSVVYCTQNLFQGGKHARTIRLNSNYFVLFRQIHDRLQIVRFFVSMRPKNWEFLLNAYDDATTRQFGYFFMDLRPVISSEILRLRSEITPNSQILYIDPSDPNVSREKTII